MADRSQINMRMDSERKEEWQQYVDESGDFKTISDLIRTSVSNEIKREEGTEVTSSVNVDGLKDEITDVKTLVMDLQSDVDELKRLSERVIEQTQDTQETDPERLEKILNLVPEEKKTSSPTGGPVSQSTRDMIGQETGYPPSAVEYYLELAAEDGKISKDIVDGIPIYWKGDE